MTFFRVNDLYGSTEYESGTCELFPLDDCAARRDAQCNLFASHKCWRSCQMLFPRGLSGRLISVLAYQSPNDDARGAFAR